MAAKDPTAVAAKWSRNLANSTQSITDGVNAVTQAPTVAAANKRTKWVQKMADKNVQDKWEKNLRAVSLSDWQQAMLEKGVPHIGQGAQMGESKVATFLGKLLPYQQTNLSKIKSMSDVSPADMKARMSAWFDIMSAFKP